MNNTIILIYLLIIISVCLQPLNFNPFEKYKHKFMIQSIVGHGDVPDDILNKYMNAVC